MPKELGPPPPLVPVVGLVWGVPLVVEPEPDGVVPLKVVLSRLSTPVAALTAEVAAIFVTPVVAKGETPPAGRSFDEFTVRVPPLVLPSPAPNLNCCGPVEEVVAAFVTVMSVPTP